VTGFEFGLLGPVEVRRDGRLLSIGGSKQRAVLALLLLTPNERVSSDRLIEELWQQNAPPTAAKSLQMHVARLRHILHDGDQAEHDAVLHTLGGGYLIRVEPDALDRDRFEAAASAGRVLLASGDPEAAGGQLRAGLAEWRGPALADVADEPFARLEVVRLEELRIATLEDRIQADLATGRHAELVGELETLVAEETFRERLWSQLVLALYRSGRQAESLAAFQRVRAHLVDQLGIEPGLELRNLHDAVLRQDEDLDWRPPPRASTIRLDGAEMPATSGPRHNLPAVPTSFVGRSDEVLGIAASVEDHRLVTLTGVGGVGKTRLALEVAERTLDRWPDGVWLVELASISDPSAVAEAVAAALGLTIPADRAVEDAVGDRLEERDLLLIFDNCEHLLEACASFAARIARGRSRSRLLATSRARLGVAGELVIPVPPLTTPGEPGDLAHPTEFDAVNLFLARASVARPQFLPNEHDLSAIADLCRALDGLPLAIELAASRVRVMTPTEILMHLGSQLDLGGYERDPDPRHRSLEATIRWSYDLLDEGTRTAFRQVTVFAASFALSAAANVVVGPDAVNAIVSLVENSILGVVPESDETRYRMLESLREFGLRRLAEADEDPDARDRQLDWALALVEQAAEEAETQGRTRAVARVMADYRNLVAAVAGDGSVTKRLRLAAGLAELLAGATSLREIRRMLEDVTLAAGASNTRELRRARLLLGRALCRLGEFDAAREDLSITAEYAAAADDRPLAASVAADQALVEIKACRPGEALAFLEQSDRLGAADYKHVWSYRLLVEAQLRYILLEELEAARELYEACIAQVRREGPVAHLLTALAALAELAVDLEDPETVERCAREVLDIADPKADAYRRGGALLALGRAALRDGRTAEATSWLAEGATTDIELGCMEAPEMLESLADAVAQAGGGARAATLLGVASAQRERLGLDPLEREQAHIDAALGAIHAALPESDLQRCLADGRELGERDLLALLAELPKAPVATAS
jgi:predicted ATPase/DNA-binding SARP family transcriptional activator